MDKNSQSFSYSEEAFLLASLHEVVKVWSRGSGQASFNLDISDGVADLKLSFKLGLPTEPHCDQSVLHEVPLKPHHYFQENVKQKRHKGQVRRENFCEEIPIAPMGVLAPGSAHARPSARPPIDTSGNFCAFFHTKKNKVR